MSTIEKAAKRLEELRRAGIEIPVSGQTIADASSANSNDPLLVRAPATPAAPTVEVRPTPTARGEPGAKEVAIDLTRLAASGIVTPNSARSQIADEFRVVKRPLLDNIRAADTKSGANLVMVTSALPGEGKTFVAINLAMSIAMELDKTVLLVDADVARPSLLSTLGLPPSPGLMDLLTEESVTFNNVLLRSNVEKLTLLPAGSPQSRSTELLASQSMAGLVQELSNRYSDRVIVFDAPPLLPTTESRVLASHMGQIVVVVGADSTTQGTLRQALSTVQSCPVVMTLLNKAVRSEVGSYYGYRSYGYAG